MKFMVHCWNFGIFRPSVRVRAKSVQLILSHVHKVDTSAVLSSVLVNFLNREVKISRKKGEDDVRTPKGTASVQKWQHKRSTEFMANSLLLRRSKLSFAMKFQEFAEVMCDAARGGLLPKKVNKYYYILLMKTTYL